MSDIFVMQRANGDVFAHGNNGRFRVPLFRSRNDAMMARLRDLGMLLFKPVPLDARLLEQIVPKGTAAELDFWLIDDPLITFDRGRLVPLQELALLVENRSNPKTEDATDKTTSLSILRHSNSKATAAWEDEGGLYSKCA